MEISVEADPVAHEALCAFLFDLGCEGLVTEDFGETGVKGYLPLGQDLKGDISLQENVADLGNRINIFLRNLRNIFPEIQPPKLHFQKIEHQDWNRSWRRFFHADQITPNLMIVPAWEPIPYAFKGVVIRMDPGPAFGSGQHPTTRMCLEAMEDTSSFESSWNMLDVGTGSGILAIYGAKLGAERIVALDLDPEAIRWAERNIALNHLSGAIELSTGPLEQWQDRFSLVVANLVLDPILVLFPHLLRVLEPGGRLILSGILRDQVNRVMARFADHDGHHVQVFFQEEWACLVARKERRGQLTSMGYRISNRGECDIETFLC